MQRQERGERRRACRLLKEGDFRQMGQQNPWAGAGLACFKNSTEARTAGQEGEQKTRSGGTGARSPRAFDGCRIPADTLDLGDLCLKRVVLAAALRSKCGRQQAEGGLLKKI